MPDDIDASESNQGGTPAGPPDTTPPPATPAAPDTGAAAAPAGPQKVALDEGTIKQIITGVTPPPAQPQQPPLTQDQIDELLRVYKVSPQDATALGLQPEAVEHLNRVLDAKVRQAVAMASLQAEVMRRSLLETISPIQSFMREANERQLRAEFFEQNKEFVGFEPLVEAAYAAMVRDGVRFQSKPEAFKAVADRTRQIMNSMPGLRNAQGQAGTRTSTPGSGQGMSTVLTGGQGGAGGGGAATSEAQKLAKSLFFS